MDYALVNSAVTEEMRVLLSQDMQMRPKSKANKTDGIATLEVVLSCYLLKIVLAALGRTNVDADAFFAYLKVYLAELDLTDLSKLKKELSEN